MADDPGFLVSLGLNFRDIVAGFSGGVVNCLIFKRSDPTSIISSMIVGACTSNYLSDPIGHYLGTGPGPSGFIVGLTSMALCQGLVESAKSWRPFTPRENPDANRKSS